MRRKTYSQLVLIGMKKAGYVERKLALVLQVRPATVKLIANGARKLTDRQEDFIEAKTGVSSAQFAMNVLDPEGSTELSRIIDRMVAVTPIRTSSKPSESQKTPLRSHRSLKLV